MLVERVKNVIRDVPDFPKPGIIFKDITPVFSDSNLCKDITAEIVSRFSDKKPDAIVGIESRGFLFGFSMALALDIPFILARKQGKLPYQKHSFEYSLEYGSAVIEMHINSIKPGWDVLIHDDLLATGGTACAAAELIKMQGGNVLGYAFLIELEFLNGKSQLSKYSGKVESLVHY